MKVSESIMREAIGKISGAKDEAEARKYVFDTFDLINKENPRLADFIEYVLEVWKEDPPLSLEKQLEFLLTDLVILSDMFKRQEEVDDLERRLGK